MILKASHAGRRVYRRAVALCGIACACCGALLGMGAGCSEGSHLLVGQIFNSARGCLAAPTAIDVIAGADPGICAPVCLVGPSLTGGSASIAYVTTTCGPYPPLDALRTDGDCAAALSAFARKDSCAVDGGSSNPLADAAADAVAQADTGAEASADAGVANEAGGFGDVGIDAELGDSAADASADAPLD